MTTAKERLEQAERRLQQVEGLQHVLEQASHELVNYRLALKRKLAWLGQADGRPAVPVAPGRSAGTQRKATVQAVPGTQRMTTVTPPAAPPPPPAAPPPPPTAPVVRAKLTPPKVTRPSLFRSKPPPEPEPVAEVEEVVPPYEADDDDGSERRTAPRRKGNPVPVKLNDPISNTEPQDGWVVDRSTGGVRILTDQSIKPGTQLTIRPAKAQAGFPWIKIVVRSCSPERSSFSLGCMFQQKLSWAEMQGFG